MLDLFPHGRLGEDLTSADATHAGGTWNICTVTPKWDDNRELMLMVKGQIGGTTGEVFQVDVLWDNAIAGAGFQIVITSNYTAFPVVFWETVFPGAAGAGTKTARVTVTRVSGSNTFTAFAGWRLIVMDIGSVVGLYGT